MEFDRNRCRTLLQLAELEGRLIIQYIKPDEKIHYYKGVGVKARGGESFHMKVVQRSKILRYTTDMPVSSTPNLTDF